MGEIANEENYQKILKEEYDENKSKEPEVKLTNEQFYSVLDDHISEMKQGKTKNPKEKEINPVKSKNAANKPQNQIIADLSEDDDFEVTQYERAEKVCNKEKQLDRLMMDTVETLTKMKNNVEYDREEITSLSGGKLIINTVKKTKHKGKAQKNSKGVSKIPENIPIKNIDDMPEDEIPD